MKPLAIRSHRRNFMGPFCIYTAAALIVWSAAPVPTFRPQSVTLHTNTISDKRRTLRPRTELAYPPHKLQASTKASNDSNLSQDNVSANMAMTEENTPSMLSTVVTKIGSTTSILVAGTFYAVLCYQRDAFMLSFFIGAISNGILSKVLKKVLQQSRPSELDPSSMELVPGDNGMPSSHAMSLGFICTFTALTLPITTIPLILYALISLVYRLQVKLHSLDQIAVGSVIGSFNGAIWWQLCTGTNNPRGIHIVDWVAASPVIDSRTGLVPWYLLSIPALVGAAVVGSVERRLARYFGKRRYKAKGKTSD